jgi:hypothetical protein
MESEKIKEIKEALECWQESVMLSTDENYVSHKVYNREILDYINELESENERLSNTEIGELIKENEELAKQCEDWCEITLKKRNQIVELKDRIAELEKENGELLKENEGYRGSYRCAIDKIGELSAERYIKLKQFAEMLIDKKIKLGDRFNIYDIDETLKEFIND